MNRRHDSCRGSWDTKCTENTNICLLNTFPVICRGASYWEADVKDLLLLSSYTLFGVACRYIFFDLFFRSVSELALKKRDINFCVGIHTCYEKTRRLYLKNLPAKVLSLRKWFDICASPAVLLKANILRCIRRAMSWSVEQFSKNAYHLDSFSVSRCCDS